MIHNLKPYLTYKDSGVPWLGEVPEHWEVKRLKHTSTLHGRIGFHGLSTSDYGSSGIIVVSGSNFRDWHVNWDQCHRLSEDWYEKDANIQLRNGDLLVTKDGTIGKTAIVSELTERAVLNSGVIVVRPRMPVQYENRYLLYLINSKVFDVFIDIKKTGATIHHLYEATFNNFSISLPQISEQSTIVKFLDHANRRIRRYIRSKQKLIKLLEEQKQAIIHKAVTRGLDPDIKLKPSGVEWLGDVPEHWEVLRSRYIFREVDDRSVIGQETHLSMSQKHGLIRSDQIETRRLISESYAGAKICACGDLVLNRLKAHLGVFALATERGLVSPDYTVLRPSLDIIPSYFEFVYRTPACRVELRQRAKGIVQGFWRLYTDDFYQIPVPVPPKQEQEYIVTALEEKIRKIKEIITQTEIEISLLREYRTRLIADVVTGKLDVREAAANLPEEAKETETFADSLADDELENDEMGEQVGELEEEVLA